MADADKENVPYLTDSEIESLTKPQLQDYLRRHNQYVSGKKNDLILRAQGVRKLQTRGDSHITPTDSEVRKTTKLVTPLGETLPPPNRLDGWTDDLMKVPDFTESDLYNYFVLKMGTRKPLRSKVYFEDRHVHGILYNEIDSKLGHCFVKCKCIPSIPTQNTKANPDHNVWICLSKVTGQVHSAECDCTAGSGESCNHVGALMYALAALTSKRKDGTLSATSQKCLWNQFNNPRKRKLTPRKASELTFKKYSFGPAAEKLPKNARKELFKNSFNVDRFREKLSMCNPSAGWLLNYVESRSEDPSPPQFLEVKYYYMDSVDLESENVKNDMLKVMQTMEMTASDCNEIEKLTRGQHKNSIWNEERKNRLTASTFGEICNLRINTPIEGSVKRNLYPTKLNNKFTNWGIKHEAAAKRQYINRMKKTVKDLKVTDCGLYVKSNAPYLGASPDGIVTYTEQGAVERGILEVKCPASDKWRNSSPEECSRDPEFFCFIDPATKQVLLKTNHRYYYQVQGQMAISGLEWCDFVIWTLSGMSIQRIYFDKDTWDSMFMKLKSFYLKAVLPELFSRRVQRGKTLY